MVACDATKSSLYGYDQSAKMLRGRVQFQCEDEYLIKEEERFWRTGRKETGFWYQLAHSRESSQSLECQYVYQYDPAMYIIMLLIHY